jgi:hypothetical protein
LRPTVSVTDLRTLEKIEKEISAINISSLVTYYNFTSQTGFWITHEHSSEINLCHTITLIDLRTLEMIEKETSAINISFTSDILPGKKKQKTSDILQLCMQN